MLHLSLCRIFIYPTTRCFISFSLILRLPLRSTLFPYTTLFRSDLGQRGLQVLGQRDLHLELSRSRAASDDQQDAAGRDRKSTRLNSSHVRISYAVFCLKKKKEQN